MRRWSSVCRAVVRNTQIYSSHRRLCTTVAQTADSAEPSASESAEEVDVPAPIHPWQSENLPGDYWNDVENRKAFLGHIASVKSFEHMEDWYKITDNDMEANAGNNAERLLSLFGNAAEVIMGTYNDHVWTKWKFSGVPLEWSPEKLKEVTEYISSELKIDKLEDWYGATAKKLSRLGLRDMLVQHGGVGGFLKAAFPEHTWLPTTCATSSAAQVIPAQHQNRNMAVQRLQQPTIWNGAFQSSKSWVLFDRVNGVSALWHGPKQSFRLRHGVSITPPPSFLKLLPPSLLLDGDLSCEGAKDVMDVYDALKSTEDWSKVVFNVMDIVSATGNTVARHNYIRKNVKPSANVKIVPKVECTAGLAQVIKQCASSSLAKNGEGTLLQTKDSLYTAGQSQNLFATSLFKHQPAIVKSSPFPMTLECEFENGVEFLVTHGSHETPSEGSVVDIKYKFLTKEGKPRFATSLIPKSPIDWEEVKNGTYTSRMEVDGNFFNVKAKK